MPGTRDRMSPTWRAGRRVTRWRDGQFFCRHIGFEPIATARHCPQQARSVVAQSAPQLTDALHQHVVRYGDVRPDRSKQLVLRNQTTGVLDEMPENCKCLGPKDNVVIFQKETTPVQIQDVAIEPQSLCRCRRCRFAIHSRHLTIQSARPRGSGCFFRASKRPPRRPPASAPAESSDRRRQTCSRH